MSRHVLAPRLVHPLPPAPHFVGREPELAELRSFWQAGGRGVLALVGLGGAGKTAVAARFLDELTAHRGGLFVWSFYQEPDAGLCMQEAYRYFAHSEAAAPAKGLGLLHPLQDALMEGGPHLLVLDGLERVQRQSDSGSSSTASNGYNASPTAATTGRSRTRCCAPCSAGLPRAWPRPRCW